MSSSPQSPYLPSISEDAVHPAARDLGLFLPEGSAVLDNARQLNHIAVRCGRSCSLASTS